jgi:hypothetical protein
MTSQSKELAMIRHKSKILALGLVLFVGGLMGLGGCSHESDNIPTKVTTNEVLMKEAWDDYGSGSYNSAIKKFQEILNRDATITEAYVGLGWGYTLAGTFDKGRNNFVFAQARADFNPFKADVYAGMASNYAASNEDSLAVLYAKKVLEVDPEWVFFKNDELVRNDNLNAHDLHVLIAQSYFHKKRYMYAKDEVDIMEPGWSSRFATTSLSGLVTPLGWTVSTDSLSVSFTLPETGVSSIVATGTIPNPMVSQALLGVNKGRGTISNVTVGNNVLTEYWTVTCIDSVKKGGIFSVIGSKSGRHPDYDILKGAYTSENGEVSFTITSDRRYYFTEMDKFSFATMEAGVSFDIDQVNEGNIIYISLDPATTDAKFFKDVTYKIFLDYRYFDDFGDFVVRLMEKINSLYSM